MIIMTTMAIMTNNNNLNLKYRMIVYNVDNHKNQNNDSNLSNDIDEGDDNYIRRRIFTSKGWVFSSNPFFGCKAEMPKVHHLWATGGQGTGQSLRMHGRLQLLS